MPMRVQPEELQFSTRLAEHRDDPDATGGLAVQLEMFDQIDAESVVHRHLHVLAGQRHS